jgi:hypothetical protein
MPTSRRKFLKTAGTAAGVLMGGLPTGWAGGVYADDSPETSTIRFGIIALTDCAPIVMAHELGFFKKFGISSIVSKEASWAVKRVMRSDLYLEATKETGNAAAIQEQQKITLFDGAFDGSDPDQYALSFPVKAVA